MKFENIPKKKAKEKFAHITNEENFYRFVKEHNLVGVTMSQPQTVSASYFLRLLKNGASEKTRGYGRSNVSENDENSNQLRKYYMPLFDHGALWKHRDGSVICTAMPYGDQELIYSMFYKMVEEFDFPPTIKMGILDDAYKYRTNGNVMIVIYCEMLDKTHEQLFFEDKLQEISMEHCGDNRVRSQTVNSYIRNRHVSEYAKCRAKGYCQLCGNRAPFYDKNERPYLEAHHIIRLADGGSDSINNVVALCPNCHRKMHYLNLEEDVNSLMEKVSQVE